VRDRRTETLAYLRGLLGWRPAGPVGWAAVAAAVLTLVGVCLALVGPLSAEPSRADTLAGSGSGTGTPPAPGKASAATSPSTPASATAPAGSPIGNPKTLEDQLVQLINQARTEAGCKKLGADGHLRTAARAHSADMAATGTVSHTGSDGSSPQDRMSKTGYRNGKSEDIGSGYRSAPAALSAWTADAKQRQPLQDCDLKAIGVGVAVAANGVPYWTADFGS
jgi:uncharacterized protein YkwD